MISRLSLRWTLGIASLFGLLGVFLFQGVDVAGHFGWTMSGIHRFLFNRSIRFFLNDGFMIGVIYALFGSRRYVLFALVVQVIEIIFFLLPYFMLKIYYPSYNGPLLSFLHRLILNPTLLLLLVPAFYYQRKVRSS